MEQLYSRHGLTGRGLNKIMQLEINKQVNQCQDIHFQHFPVYNRKVALQKNIILVNVCVIVVFVFIKLSYVVISTYSIAFFRDKPWQHGWTNLTCLGCCSSWTCQLDWQIKFLKRMRITHLISRYSKGSWVKVEKEGKTENDYMDQF